MVKEPLLSDLQSNSVLDLNYCIAPPSGRLYYFLRSICISFFSYWAKFNFSG